MKKKFTKHTIIASIKLHKTWKIHLLLCDVIDELCSSWIKVHIAHTVCRFRSPIRYFCASVNWIVVSHDIRFWYCFSIRFYNHLTDRTQYTASEAFQMWVIYWTDFEVDFLNESAHRIWLSVCVFFVLLCVVVHINDNFNWHHKCKQH